MLTVGEFSKICRVSTKTLRYYDSINLLKPTWVDTVNDYRYYTFDQLERMLLINKLKEYQFPLVEIYSILGKNDNEYLAIQLEQKQHSLINQIEYEKKIILELENDIKTVKKGGRLIVMSENIEIKIVNTETQKVALIRRIIKESEGEQLFNDLVHLVEREKLEVYSQPISIYYNKEHDGKLDMEVCVPIINGDTNYTHILDGGECIYTRYVGKYENLPNVYLSLFKWKGENGYELIAPPYQKHIESSNITNNPN
jgi:DNA-binding transcriptional MerR regulator